LPRSAATWLDDHARYALHVSAHPRITAPIVLATFRETAGHHGFPASTLTHRSRDSHDRVRRDTIDSSGCVTLRVNGRLHHIGIGRTHARIHVLLLVQDLDIRIIDAATRELLRELSKDYQGTGRRPGPAPRRSS
jgi:hypothetical protein